MESIPIRWSVYLRRSGSVFRRYFLSWPCENKAAGQIKVMACPQEGLQLLAAYIRVLPPIRIGAYFPFASEFIGRDPFVRFTDLIGLAPVRFADARLIKGMRHPAGAIAATDERRGLVLGV